MPFFLGDIHALRTILLYHFNKGIFIGGGLENRVTNLLKSLQGNNIKVIFVSGARPAITHIRQHYVCLPKGIVHPKIQITDYLLCLWFASAHFDHFWVFFFPSGKQYDASEFASNPRIRYNGHKWRHSLCEPHFVSRG